MDINHPKILVIIVTWDKKEYVVNLLNSLANINYPRTSLDIVVVDNASSDGTAEAIQRQFSHIHLIQNQENLGGTGGFNTGLAYAFEQPDNQYDYLWLLDNDVVVHQQALAELVNLLEQHTDIAIAGSTMMQLDYRWRINEMGAFVDRGLGTLVLNRHLEKIGSWQDKDLSQLLQTPAALDQQLKDCQPYMDVDYVAAASLLIRTKVAKQAGLWLDFFIHFDDVEWCLRIENMGYRTVVSARSLIWHLSAIGKVPSWVLYYDNRNTLYLLERHSDTASVKRSSRRIIKKTLYYMLTGKQDLAMLHLQALDDYQNKITGKKEIKLDETPQDRKELSVILNDSKIKKILIPWTVDFQATNTQELFVQAIKQRDDLQIHYLIPPKGKGKTQHWQIPGCLGINTPGFSLFRYLKYLKYRNEFDLVFQSDYQMILPLSWLNARIIFINKEYFTLRNKTNISKILTLLPDLLNRYFKLL